MAKYIITAAAPKRLGDHQNTGVGTEIELSQGFGEAFVSMHWLIDPEAEARTKAAAEAEAMAKAEAEAASGGASKSEDAENPENPSAGGDFATSGGEGSPKQKGRPAAKK